MTALKKRRNEGARWAAAIGLDVSAKPDKWRVTVALETSGELPKAFHSGRTIRVTLDISDFGWSIRLSQPVGRWERISSYVSSKPREHRWYEYFVRGANVSDKPRPKLRKRDLLERPKKLDSIRRWLTRAEEKLGIRFRRDRPLIQSKREGRREADGRVDPMAAWPK